jgi:uncharacterized protein (TIGR01777 family)
LTQAQHEVTVLTRSRRSTNERYLTYKQWNGKEMPMGMGIYDAVINLAGASIGDNRWTEENKKLILDSRIDATRACVNFIERSPNPPSVFVSASAVGYYGVEFEGEIDENAPPGKDFAAQVCAQWEAEAKKADVRTVMPRIGLVLGKNGGLLDRLAPIYKMWLGGKMGSGEQGFPWVHRQDVIGTILFFLENEQVEGPVNIVAPQVVNQARFSAALAQAVGTKDIFTIPRFALNLIFGEQALLFWGGQKAIPRRLQRGLYKFAFPELEKALGDILD